jgi:hypothetical protein
VAVIDPPPPGAAVIVSNPVPVQGTGTDAALGLALSAAGGDSVVYVSLPPGSVPEGVSATVRSLPAGGSLTTTVTSGGFDPIRVGAGVGDTIEVVVRDGGGAVVLEARAAAVASRRPIVVRTDPPPRKRDVPLNAAIMVVFSEPVDGGTVTPASIQLLRGTTPVAGTVRLVDASGLVALFEPAQLLAPATAYRLAVGQAVRDLDGDGLEAPVVIDFTTGDALTGGVASVTVFPHLIEMVYDDPPPGWVITAEVRDASGNVLLGPAVQWASSDTVIAVVSPTSARDAVVRLRAEGVATITATSEGLSDTAVVRSRPLGSVRVTTATTGADLDLGYYVLVAGAGYWRSESVPANGSVAFPGVPAGDHSVTLGGVATNCYVLGANPQTVTVTGGATSEVAFAVTCGSGAPSLRVTMATTGGDLDPTGYRVNVLGVGFQDGAPVNGSVAFYFLPPGEYWVELQDIAWNCEVSGANPQAVTVTDGATAELAFAVTCNAFNGSIWVTTVTTGEDFDPNGYWVMSFVDPWGERVDLPANGSVALYGVPPGEHTISLYDVASNCAVVGGDAQTVTVSAGDTSEVVFAVTCVGDLPSLRVTIATTGTDIDPDGFRLDVVGLACGSEPWQCGQVPVNGTFTYSGLTPREYEVQLSDVAANCSVSANPQLVTVTRGATADVVFAVTCAALGDP